jgi:hypothetical protein
MPSSIDPFAFISSFFSWTFLRKSSRFCENRGLHTLRRAAATTRSLRACVRAEGGQCLKKEKEKKETGKGAYVAFLEDLRQDLTELLMDHPVRLIVAKVHPLSMLSENCVPLRAGVGHGEGWCGRGRRKRGRRGRSFKEGGDDGSIGLSDRGIKFDEGVSGFLWARRGLKRWDRVGASFSATKGRERARTHLRLPLYKRHNVFFARTLLLGKHCEFPLLGPVCLLLTLLLLSSLLLSRLLLGSLLLSSLGGSLLGSSLLLLGSLLLLSSLLCGGSLLRFLIVVVVILSGGGGDGGSGSNPGSGRGSTRCFRTGRL